MTKEQEAYFKIFDALGSHPTDDTLDELDSIWRRLKPHERNTIEWLLEARGRPAPHRRKFAKR